MNELLTDHSRTFVFYPSWLTFVDGIEGTDNKFKMLYAIVEYGCSGDHTEVDDPVIENTFQNLVRPLIDKAQGRYQRNVENGRNKGRPRIAQEDLIAELVEQGYRGNEIADKLCLTPSAVYKTEAWKNRKKKKTTEKAPPQEEDFTDNFVF